MAHVKIEFEFDFALNSPVLTTYYYKTYEAFLNPLDYLSDFSSTRVRIDIKEMSLKNINFLSHFCSIIESQVNKVMDTVSNESVLQENKL